MSTITARRATFEPSQVGTIRTRFRIRWSAVAILAGMVGMTIAITAFAILIADEVEADRPADVQPALVECSADATGPCYRLPEGS